MDPIIIYFIKVNLVFAVLYVFYKTVFAKDTFFGLRRLVLLLICIAAITFPFLNFGGWLSVDNPFNLHGLYTYNINIPEIWIRQTSESVAVNFPVEKIIYTVYFAGVALLSARTLMELINTGKLFHTSNKKVVQSLPVRIMSGHYTPFSFIKWIFINPDLYRSEELNEILIHEHTHIREKHFIDLLLIQPVIILNWFNPFVWLIRKEMRLNHEYLADRSVVSAGIDRKSYQYHLLGLEPAPPTLVNLSVNFNILPLKQRIKMLNKKRTRNIMKSKYLMFIPLLGILLLTQQQANSRTSETKPVASFQKQNQPEDPTLEVAEVMPEFPGGMPALMSYLGSHVRYPTEAVNKKLSGQVIVQFVVNKDGTPVDATVVNTTSKIFNEAALNAIKGMPKWKPGEQDGKKVRVKFTLPVNFKTK